MKKKCFASDIKFKKNILTDAEAFYVLVLKRAKNEKNSNSKYTKSFFPKFTQIGTRTRTIIVHLSGDHRIAFIS